ncbi:MAG: hypothetical protein IJB86_03515, partial [Clostridia bacterium]|nr:hypothetical protein [Clostridia bacterium]
TRLVSCLPKALCNNVRVLGALIDSLTAPTRGLFFMVKKSLLFADSDKTCVTKAWELSPGVPV